MSKTKTNDSPKNTTPQKRPPTPTRFGDWRIRDGKCVDVSASAVPQPHAPVTESGSEGVAGDEAGNTDVKPTSAASTPKSKPKE